MNYLSRSQSRFWSTEIPVGDSFGGPAYGEKRDPATAMLAVTAVGAIGAVGAMQHSSSPPAPPTPPGVDPAAKAARDAAEEDARKRAQYGRSSTYGTTGGALGDTSTPNLAAKSLLGT